MTNANIVMGPEDPCRDVGTRFLALGWARFVFARIPSTIKYLVLIYDPDVSDRYEDIPIPFSSYQSDRDTDRVHVWKCASLDEAQEIFSKLSKTKGAMRLVVARTDPCHTSA